jgi:glycolate oxidase iron-sulfur subunit
MATLERLGAFDLRDPPDMEGIRACVHCGICLPQCPTYRVLGVEMDSPRGRVYLMRAAAEGRIGITPTFARHIDLCLGCRACETACPSGVPFGRLLEATRGQIERAGVRPRVDRMFTPLILSLFPHPDRLDLVLRGLRFYQRAGLQRVVRSSGIFKLFPRLGAMEALLPPLPAATAPLPPRMAARGARKGTAGLLLGCIQRLLFPQVNTLTARLLTLAGYDVVVPPDQGCCGALNFHGGRLDEGRGLATRLVSAFGSKVDVIVTNAAGCGSVMGEYPHWLPGNARVAAFSGKVRDVSELLADIDLPLRPLKATAAYHDPCHLVHGKRVRSQPRALLGKIPGLTVVELADSELCCGSAGVYNLLEPEMAERLLEMKVNSIAETRASILVTGNPGCLLQIAKGCRSRGLQIEVLHPMELLGRVLEASPR